LGFLEQLALVGDADAETGGERVSLMTLHAAKGLEFDAVWMTGMEERVFPNARSLGLMGSGTGEEDEHEIAEERRLCYVGMTRARKRLALTLARRRTLFGDLRFNAPSRFLRELPKEVTDGLQQLDAQREPQWARDEGFAPRSGESDRRGVAATDRGPLGGERESRQTIEYDYDQRPAGWSEQGPSGRPPPLRPMLRSARNEPLARPPMREAAPGMEGRLGRGSKVRHATFGVGTVEESDGAGAQLKLTVRFPSVGVKKVLARFLEPA
jgi:DNA helicase-2/ATP-dependent DNA helicase PcrA